jgi:intracellular sulfur oxidation DsrE/DsrF family protein
MLRGRGRSGARLVRRQASYSRAAERHKVFYHLDGPAWSVAKAVLVNIENHVSVVGWKNIGRSAGGLARRCGLLAKDMDPDVRGKLETLMAGGLRFDACQNTMARQKIEMKDLIEARRRCQRVVRVMDSGGGRIRP